MRICVVSDMHYPYQMLDERDKENAELVLSFLTEARGNYDMLVLNGDIFDLWFDWKYTIIKQYFPLLHRLAAIQDEGCKLVMISGNHDFWFNDFFQKYLPIPIYDESYNLIADGKKILFTHGDLHPEYDVRYKLFRRLIRFGGIKKIFSWFHPDFSLAMAARLTRSSRMKNFMQPKKTVGLKKYAKYIITKEKYDYVCMGHSHQPEIQEIGNGKYINTGDWTRHHTYVEIIDGKVEIRQYKIKEIGK